MGPNSHSLYPAALISQTPPIRVGAKDAGASSHTGWAIPICKWGINEWPRHCFIVDTSRSAWSHAHHVDWSRRYMCRMFMRFGPLLLWVGRWGWFSLAGHQHSYKCWCCPLYRSWNWSIRCDQPRSLQLLQRSQKGNLGVVIPGTKRYNCKRHLEASPIVKRY